MVVNCFEKIAQNLVLHQARCAVLFTVMRPNVVAAAICFWSEVPFVKFLKRSHIFSANKFTIIHIQPSLHVFFALLSLQFVWTLCQLMVGLTNIYVFFLQNLMKLFGPPNSDNFTEMVNMQMRQIIPNLNYYMQWLWIAVLHVFQGNPFFQDAIMPIRITAVLGLKE